MRLVVKFFRNTFNGVCNARNQVTEIRIMMFLHPPLPSSPLTPYRRIRSLTWDGDPKRRVSPVRCNALGVSLSYGANGIRF